MGPARRTLRSQHVAPVLEHTLDRRVDRGLVREVLRLRVCTQDHSVCTFGTYRTNLSPFVRYCCSLARISSAWFQAKRSVWDGGCLANVSCGTTGLWVPG